MVQTQDKVYWIWLSSIPEIGSKRFYYLIERFGSPKGVWDSDVSELKEICRFMGSRAVQSIINHKKPVYVEQAQKIYEDPSINVITLIDDEYPKLLKTIYHPPTVLYCKRKPLTETPFKVSIVGSR